MALDFKKQLGDSNPFGTRLTYERGRFRVEGALHSRRQYLDKNPYWTCVGRGVYETQNLREAAALRRFGDEDVNQLFNRAFQTHYDLPRLPHLPQLDPHQLDGLQWILQRKRSYNAQPPGAGKTAQAILAGALAPGPGPTLLIVPPSLVVNWGREIWKVTEWIGVYPTIGVVGRSDDQGSVAWRADFVICPDSMLAKDWVYHRLRGLRPKLIAVDEASRFKEWTTERSLAFYGGRVDKKSYPGLFRDARHVVFIDGSPMPNRPMELWAPTYALHPEAIDCMDQNDFGYRYCGARPNERGVWEFKHSSHEAELKEKLQRDFMFTLPEDTLAHPERRRSLVFIDHDARSPEHKTWERRHLTTLSFDEIDEDMSRGDIATYRKELGLAKVDWVVEYARMRLEKGEQVLIFAWHREVCQQIWGALHDGEIKCGLIMGGTPAKSREEYIRRFQAAGPSGGIRCLVLNIAAGGRGHNIQAADRVIFAEYSWSDELNRQCEKRASRRGSTKAFVPCEYTVSPGSMDEPILNSIFTKQTRVRRIIG